jgi:hypothetical protein
MWLFFLALQCIWAPAQATLPLQPAVPNGVTNQSRKRPPPSSSSPSSSSSDTAGSSNPKVQTSEGLLPGNLPFLGVVTWNVNGLCSPKPSHQQNHNAKVCTLKRLAAKYQVIALQELHGDNSSLEWLRNTYRKTHVLYVAKEIHAPDRGGVAFLVCRTILENTTKTPQWDTLYPDRAISLRIDYQDGFLSFHNFHVAGNSPINHNKMTAADQKGLARKALDAIKRAQSDSEGAPTISH